MAEWSKALAWKVSIRQKRIEGSNPSRSANPPAAPRESSCRRLFGPGAFYRRLQEARWLLAGRICQASAAVPNVKVGVGYNFTDYSDDLADLSHRNHGFFFNVVGKF